MRFFAGFWKSICQDLFPAYHRGRLTRGLFRQPESFARRLARAFQTVHHSIAIAIRGRVFCDSPNIYAHGDPPIVSGTVECRGWAMAVEGVESVQLTLDGQPFAVAHLGVRRLDLGRRLAGFPGASRSGFYYALDTRGLTEGEHTLTVTARTRRGRMLQTSGVIEVQNTITAYERWRNRTGPNAATLEWMRRNSTHLPIAPRVSFLTAILAEEDMARLPGTLESLRRQTYPHCELILSCSEKLELAVSKELERCPDGFAQLVSGRFAGRNQALNAALGQAAGDFFGLVDPGDVLEPSALFELIYALNRHPQHDFVYSDEEVVAGLDRPVVGCPPAHPIFKPAWSPDLLLGFNYVGRLWIARRRLLGGEEAFQDDLGSAAEYDLIFRLTDRAAGVGHVPAVLVRRLPSPPAASEETRRALQAALARRDGGEPVPGLVPGVWRTSRPVSRTERVSIIFQGTPESGGWLLNGLSRHSPENRPDVVFVDATGPGLAERLNRCAFGAAGGFLLFVRADGAITADWVQALCEHGRRPEVGAVGGFLVDATGRVGCGGLRLAEDDRLVVPIAQDFEADPPGTLPFLATDRDCSAVSSACLLVRRELFQELNGFDERLEPPLLEADFCLHARQKGYRIVATPHARLEKRTQLFSECSPAAVELYRSRWFSRHERGDPFFSPGFSTRHAGFRLNDEPTCLTHAPCPLFERESVQRILAVKLDHIGDVILSLPALRRLHELFPEAEITFLVGPHARHVAEAEPCVDRVLAYSYFSAKSFHPPAEITEEQQRAIRDWLSGFSFDLAIDFRREIETREFVRLSGARYTAGFANLGEAEWLTLALPCEPVLRLFKPRRHMSEDPCRLVDMLEQAMTGHPPPAQAPTEEAQQEVDSILASVLPNDVKLLVGMHPGSGRAIKCWPAASFGRLAGLLFERLGATLLLFSGPDEKDLADQVLRNTPAGTPIVSLAGRLNLAQTAIAVSRCDLFIGNDSGPAHLAAVAGIPTLGIYAGTADPAQWGPLGPNAAAIQRALLCSPCYHGRVRDCPIGVPCLRQLHPEKVYEAALRLLLPRWDKLKGKGRQGREIAGEMFREQGDNHVEQGPAHRGG